MTLRQAADRYGATAVIVVALALLVALMPGNADKNSTDESALNAGNTTNTNLSGGVTDTTLPGGDLGGPATTLPSSNGSTGSSGGSGGTDGTGTVGVQVSSLFGAGPNCRADARQKGISKYMPPCANWPKGGDNGGATAQGVTKDKVTVVRFIGQSDPATDAILKGAKLADDPAVVTRAYKALFNYANNHYETYGRQIVFQDYNASGPDENDEQMRADAAAIATSIKPFAVFGGPKIFGQELAQRGIVCICTTSLSSEFYLANPANIWGSLPTATEYAQHLGEFIGKQLKGKNAKFAGDEINLTQGLRNKQRKFGLIYIEGIRGQVDPEGKRAMEALTAEMAKNGTQLATKIGYTYDPGRNQQDLTTMVAKMRNEGVTSVIMFVDPLYPILITGEATRQQYFPEWIISGSGLSDTTAAGRLYDQSQWKHAFGISPLWVTWSTVNKSTGYREAHNGEPGMPDKQEGVLINIYNSTTTTLFRGLHMAGPKLTAATFAQGMYNYPKTGGTAAFPLVYHTREYPTAIKDFISIYYDSGRRGVDERGLAGTGAVMKMNQGKRYQLGQWPGGDAPFFNDPSAIDTSDSPPGGGDPTDAEGGVHPSNKKCLSCA